ncbi:hypothetical protein E2C01_092822 [Portunus trituberculatus]|uniref:Uncharacterized protein n=1 Tax=Portunus trituberculatus TaxID=210409 RepID=A0A5B7JSG0_PORTR|nr:hypothetical protein [Portunus trituberculatus]
MFLSGQIPRHARLTTTGARSSSQDADLSIIISFVRRRGLPEGDAPRRRCFSAALIYSDANNALPRWCLYDGLCCCGRVKPGRCERTSRGMQQRP